jgi:hypothetical protein
MADDIKFVIGVDNKDVLKAIKDNEVLEKRVQQLGKEYAKLDKLKNKNKISAVDYSRAIRQVDSQISQLEKTIKKGGDAVGQLATGMNVSGKAARRNEIAFQQAGYQVQDFIIQVQGGVNPLIAFSQQASQLAGFFAGPWGAMIGLGIAAVSSLALAFQAVSSKADDAKSKIMSLADAQKGLNQATADYQTKIDMLKFGVDTEEEVKVLKELQAARKEDQRIREAMAATDSLGTRQRLSEELKANRVVLSQLQADAKAHADKRAEYDALKAEERAAEEKKVADAKRATSLADAERLAGESLLDKTRSDALERYNSDLEATNATLDAMFKNRTLSFSIRFAGEEKAFGASLTPETNFKPAQSYEELLKMGWTPENISAMGVDAPKAKTSTKGGGGKSPQEQLAEFLTKKKEEADLQSQLVGLFGEERDLKSELIKFEQEYGKVASERQAVEFEATIQQIAADKERQKVLEEAKQQQEQLADYIANSMGDALMSIVDGTMTVKDAFKAMATDIIKELYRVLVVQQMVNAAKSFMGFADGGAFSGGSQIQAYANGGVVGGPTTFPMAGGKTGLMGEAGPEAIMPLKRGANGKLGVQMEGGGGDTIVVNQSFNFQSNGDATIKQLIAQAAPKIAQMTKSSLLDDRRRGGSTKAAFG